MNILSNEAPMNLLPINCMISEEILRDDLNIFFEGFQRIQNVKAALSRHGVPAGNIQAVVLTAVHGMSQLEENFEVFREGKFPLTTDNASDYLRYVDALEMAVEAVINDINDPDVTQIITAQDIFEGTIVHFSPFDKYELDILGITPVNFLPEGTQEET